MSALLTLLAMTLAGHLVLALAGLERPRGRFEWLLSTMLAGLALDQALGLLAIWLMGPLPVASGRVLLALPALGGLALLLRGKRPVLVGRPAGATGPLAWVLLVAIGLLSLQVVLTASLAPVHLFDPTFHFGYKGSVLFHEGLDPSAFADLHGHIGRVMTHPTYPPGMGLLHVLVSWVDGGYSMHLGRPLLALFALAPAAWLHACLRHRGVVAARVAALLWLTLPILYYLRLPHDDFHRALVGLVAGGGQAEAWLGGGAWHRVDGPSLDGGGDLPTAAFLLGVTVHLGRWLGLLGCREEGTADRADLLLVMLCTVGLLLAKNEGVALLMVLGIGVVLALALRRKLLPDEAVGMRPTLTGLAAVAVGCALLSPWFAFQSEVPKVDESYPQRMNVRNLERALFTPRRNDHSKVRMTRVRFIGEEYLATMAQPLIWSLLWPGFLAALALALRRPRRHLEAVLPILITLGGLAVFYLILMVTPWTLGLLFQTGIPDRLFLQVAPLAALAVALVAFGRPEEESQDATTVEVEA